MPPSGFNEKAIAGLIQFLQGCYEDLLEKVRADDSPKAVEKAIQEELAEMAAFLRTLTMKRA